MEQTHEMAYFEKLSDRYSVQGIPFEQNMEFCDHLFQLGGVFVNGDRDMGSFSTFKRFEHHHLKSGKKTDLIERVRSF